MGSRTAPNQDANGDTPLVRWMKAGRPLPDLTEDVARRCAEALRIPNVASTAEPQAPRVRRDVPSGLRGYHGGVVYFIDCGEFTKIGYTREYIAKRMEGIATHNPFPLRLWALVKGSISFERAVHQTYAEQRHANEWFRFSGGAKAKLRIWVRELGGETYE